MTERRLSRVVRVGEVLLGGGNPVVVQTMTNTDTRDVPVTIAQIRAVVRAGAEIVRVAVPDMAAAQAIREIKKEVSVPIVAD
ncbi:flavodoxin-dependent (E)-4-hydroxy-3-methylbut-2-enyl-diphosphate synthase, partial [Candidatus Bipolaricaulota bacterium]|nr:flavodoxin-dependent (E)-4-hydroxy-3-methylbut-2-enyl-diphosphate synthase [Candidatus Bipolaricaulota bacterium]